MVDDQNVLSIIYDNVLDAVWLINVEASKNEINYRFISINETFTTITGLSKKEVIGKLMEDVLPPGSHEIVRKNYTKAYNSKKVVEYRETAHLPNGTKHGDIKVVPIIDKETQQVSQLLGIAHDVTDKVVEERKYQEIFKSFRDIYYETDLEGNLLVVTPSIETISGYTVEEVLSSNTIFTMKHPEQREELLEELSSVGKVNNYEVVILDKQGNEKLLSLNVGYKKDGEKIIGITGVATNIEGKAALKAVKDRLEIKETLLKEIHHRVKNNLQIITSLLGLQQMNVDEEKLKSILRDSQLRINSMGFIHEMLYQNDNFAYIKYDDYLRKLLDNIFKSVKADENIQLKIEADDIELNIDTSIPLGLLINEIVTNSLKYGVKGVENGEVYVVIKNEEDNFVLYIGDNGIGFEENDLDNKQNSLGLNLIRKLTKQLKGHLEKSSNSGTHYEVRFQEINSSLNA